MHNTEPPAPRLAGLYPSDILLFRHGRPWRERRPDLNDEHYRVRQELLDLDMSQQLDPHGRRQGRALGWRLFDIVQDAQLCISSDFPRAMQTAEAALSVYPEATRPALVSSGLLRERSRGRYHPATMTKEQFADQFPEEAAARDNDPYGWLPRSGESQKFVSGTKLLGVVQSAGILYVPDKPLVLSTSGEMCISAFQTPELGNMTNPAVERGFGPDMPAKTYEYTALSHYTRRNPHNPGSAALSDTFDHMRVISPDPAVPESVAWDTGWIPIRR